MIKIIFLLILLTHLFQNFSAQEISQETTSTSTEDFQDSLNYMWKGSYQQFNLEKSWPLLGAMAVTLPYFFIHDKRLSKRYAGSSHTSGIESFISSAGVFFNFPFAPAAFYSLGRLRGDQKQVAFAKEYFAALMISLVETNLISAIPVHPRPAPDNLTFWEKNFRYESSFPSGHTLGYNVLTFKTLQYYGPLYALIPLSATIVSSLERVESEKHYLTDVIASTFISLLASEGVRHAANQKSYNHPVYNFLINHDPTLSYILDNNRRGVEVSLSF